MKLLIKISKFNYIPICILTENNDEIAKITKKLEYMNKMSRTIEYQEKYEYKIITIQEHTFEEEYNKLEQEYNINLEKQRQETELAILKIKEKERKQLNEQLTELKVKKNTLKSKLSQL